MQTQNTQALITITVAGSEHSLTRRGRFEELIGERSVDHLLADLLETGCLHQVLLSEAGDPEEGKRVTEEIASLLACDYQVSVCREGADKSPAETPVRSPAEQKALDLATLSPPGGEGDPCYSLHLHLHPTVRQALHEEQPFDTRVEVFKQQLAPKVDAIDLRGLFRGNMRALTETFRTTQEAAPPSESRKDEG